MNNTKGKLIENRGVIFCFLASVLIAALAYYAGLKIEPGKILPEGLSMRSGPMSDSIVYGINIALDDIDLIKSGNAGSGLWRLLTFVHLDLFFYLALLLPQAAAKAVLMTGYFVRFGLCASAMYYFMSEHVKLSRMFSLLLAVMYAFSSQVIFTAQLAEIMNMAVMMPVLMSAVDSYYKKRTWKSFSLVCIASFGLGATGGFGILTGIPAMILISLLMSFGLYKTFKMAFSSWLKALGSILTGLILTAAFSVPGLYAMSFNVNISESFSKAKVSYTVYDLIRGMFALRSGGIVMNSAPVFYVGILTITAVIAFALNEAIPVRLKVASGVITAVFYISCCSSFVNETLSIFGAAAILMSARLICLGVLVFFIAGIGLKNIKTLTRGGFIATCLIPLAFLVVANNSTAGTTLAAPILAATFIAVILESGLVYALAKDKLTNKAKTVIVVAVYALVGINAAFIMFNNTITKPTVEQYFIPEYGDGTAQSLIFDSDFDLPAINGADNYQIVNADLSIFEFEDSAIDGINFISNNINDEELFEEIFITPEGDEDEMFIKGPDRYGLDVGTNIYNFEPFDVIAGERLFIYCTAMEGAEVKIKSSDGLSEKTFTGPFLTALDVGEGEVKLDFTISSEGEEVCYIALYKLNENALNGIKKLSGNAASSGFSIGTRELTGMNTLILPYSYDDTRVKIGGKYRETFEFFGKIACTFECNGEDNMEVSVERKDSGIVPGVLISAVAALCFIAIPLTQRYNKKKTVSGEGNTTNA